jgi:peptidoglycan/LPS O-acetylase OafA/YrhL
MVEQGTVTAAASRTAPRLHEIDLLRFIAALAVVLVHYTYSGLRVGAHDVAFPDLLTEITRYGYLGVDLFFLISGLVVFMSSWGRRASTFLVSRASRLYPAFWAAATLTAVVVVAVGPPGHDGVTLSQYLINLTLLPAPLGVPYLETVYWTLWAEFRFYALLFVFALIGITVKRAHWFMWAWLATSAASAVLPLPAGVGRLLDLLVQPLYSHYFIAGMALYLVYRFGYSGSLVLLLAGCYVSALYRGVEHMDMLTAEGSELSAVVVAAVVTVIFAVMILVASGALSALRRPALEKLGALTYPLYLVHATLGYVLFDLLSPTVNRWVLLVGVIGLMCVLSWAIHRWVETPLQPWMRTTLTRGWDSVRATRPVAGRR